MGSQVAQMEASCHPPETAANELASARTATSSKTATVTSPRLIPSAEPVAISGMTCSSMDSSVDSMSFSIESLSGD